MANRSATGNEVLKEGRGMLHATGLIACWVKEPMARESTVTVQPKIAELE